jgi:branched-chain amino acid transport system substrate-binding protein
VLAGELVPATGFGDWVGPWSDAVTLAIEEAVEMGSLHEPIELVGRAVEGLPTGSQHNIVKAWRELAEDEGVLAILGPSNADNGRSVQDAANEGRVPTFLFGCSSYLPSPWTFSVHWGPAPEDSIAAVRWASQQGYHRLGLLSDSAWHALEWKDFAEIAARRYGIEIVGEARIPALVLGDYAKGRQAEAAGSGVERLRGLAPDALLMITSHGSIPFVNAVHQSGWDIPRLKAGSGIGHTSEWRGWVGTCLWDDDNARGQRFLETYEKRFGTPRSWDMVISVHDAARALIEGMNQAPIMTREGVRTGLERVKMVPATAGIPGTYISFGPYAHRGYHGHVSILRQVVDPDGDSRSLVKVPQSFDI